MTFATTAFTEKAENVVLIGGAGTGKTHLATSLGVEAIARHSKRVRFYSTVELVNALEQEKAAGKAGRLALQLMHLDLVMLDELGYLPFSQAGGALLLHLLSKLYEHTSVIITTNLVFAEWTWLQNAMDLQLQTLQRPEDLVSMKWTQDTGSVLQLTVGKTGVRLAIKTSPKIREILNHCLRRYRRLPAACDVKIGDVERCMCTTQQGTVIATMEFQACQFYVKRLVSTSPRN